jgi:2-succinyl-5-enolpyruvyl-6-hydroxy-3-cyclohexene-1-carboxylate synthase
VTIDGGALRPAQATAAYVGAFVDELARAGIAHVCIAPGSRSTPLAVLVARHPALRVWMHVDERSAGFFALGLARASGAPVALLCTSGTAAANFLPAVVEAHASRVPLVVLTADRPPELRGVGAPQTIDQNRLFGGFAKWFVEVALAEASPHRLRYARTLACRAVAAAAAGPAGPVHLNFPFRDPLVPETFTPPVAADDPDGDAWHGRADGAPYVAIADAPRIADAATIETLAAELSAARRPLVVCGPQTDAALAAPLAALARAIGAPLLADPLSQLRCGAHDRSAVVDGYDAILRDAGARRRLAPDVVLRVGATPTSKALLELLQALPDARQVLLDADGWPDPTLVAARVVHADPRATCAALAQRIVGRRERRSSDATPWLAAWTAANARARAAIAERLAAVDEPFEGRALAELAALVPEGATVFASSSMPVRDLDAFFPGSGRRVRFLANRGANGIDGVVSAALGTAAAGGGPVVLVIGDLALYHDMNGLLAAKAHGLPLTIVLLNNDGGGIFSFLPQAQGTAPEEFERLFGTPHGIDFRAAAAAYGARHDLAGGWEEFRAAVGRGIATPGLALVELRTERARNVVLHREVWSAVAAALAAEPAACPA